MAAFLGHSPWSCNFFLSLSHLLLLPHSVTNTPQFCSSLSLQSYTSFFPWVSSLSPSFKSACGSHYGLYFNPHLAAKSTGGGWRKVRRTGDEYTQHFLDFILSNPWRRFRDAMKFAQNYVAHVDCFQTRLKPCVLTLCPVQHTFPPEFGLLFKAFAHIK